jgi:ABC-2 type transport system permease protein
MRDLEFRFNVLVWAIMNFFWFGLMLVSVHLIFGQVEAIAGWNKDKVLLLVLIQALFFDFLWTFVLINIGRFSRLVRRGELDLALLKPVNLRFLVSTRYFDNDHYPRILVLMYLIPKFAGSLGVPPSIFIWLNAIFLFVLGLFIFYNLFFILTTTNFWFTSLFNIHDLCSEMVDVGRAPVYIFRDKARLFFMYFIPTAFVSTFPVQALLGEIGLEMVLAGVLISVVFFAFSQWFWQFGLRHYSSVGS